jgi:hypothetical protein
MSPLHSLVRCATPIIVGTLSLISPVALAAQSADADAMDQLLGPIALYPDPLLAQVLTAATSPDQVKEFHTWLGQQTVTGSELQQAAMDADFEASFASLSLFPEVVSTMATNLDWTRELGTAYLSDADAVTQSVQRLRAKAQASGALKSNEQQSVTVETQGSTQVIVVQPTNPQVVYVPTYDPQVVYAAPPPSSSGDAAVAALIGFGVGIAIGAAIDNDPYYYGPYGWGAWSMGWHGGGVYYRRAAWVVPPRPRYPYVRPVPAYRPNRTVVAPRRTNVTVNVNRNRVNVGNQVNVGNRTTNVSKGSTIGDRPTDAANRTSREGTAKPRSTDRGRTPTSETSRKSGTKATAMSGYGNGSNARAASSRGKSSATAGTARRGRG